MNEKDNFGVPKVDSSPMGIVGMEGNFFRGLTGNSTPRSRTLKIAITVFSFVVLLIPGLLILCGVVMMFPEQMEAKWVLIFPTLLGLLFVGCGISAIRANWKK